MGKSHNFWNRVLNLGNGQRRHQNQLRNNKQTHRRLSLENLEERALLAVVAGSEIAAALDPASETLVVTTLADTVDETDGVLSLREAITAAAEGDTITFASDLSGGTIVLAGTELTINKSIAIDASSIGGMTIDANKKSSIFDITGKMEKTFVYLCNLTITAGRGYGIYNAGDTLTLTNCTVSANSGGGIYNNYNRTLTMTNCIVSANKGSGIYNMGTVTLTNCVVSGNLGSTTGGGIYNYDTITLTNCEISGNTTNTFGGGIYSSGTATLTNCKISGNTANHRGGGIYNSSTLILTNCSIVDNMAYRSESYSSLETSGGGIFNIKGTLTLTNCKVSNNFCYTYSSYKYDEDESENVSAFGGGIYNQKGTLTLTDCEISKNIASTYTSYRESHNHERAWGGGICNFGGTITMTNCAVSGNTARGLCNATGGGICNFKTVTMTNCVVSENTSNGSAGGIRNWGGTLTMINGTVLKNTTNSSQTSYGGGIENSGNLTLTNCIVAMNWAYAYYVSTAQGGGIYNWSNSENHIYNSIIVQNKTSTYLGMMGQPYYISDIECYSDIKNKIVVYGYNNLSSWTGWTSPSGNNLVYDDSRPLFVDPEYNNFTLAAGSQAIDSGCNDYVTTETDLAGRIRIGNGVVDIGAYEYQTDYPPLTGITITGGGEYYYDGKAHGVTVNGTKTEDVVYYSADGYNYSTTPITYTEIGEYRIYVKVSRSGYTDWMGSVSLVIRNSYVVTTLADTVDPDDGVLSLREAIVAAAEGEPITFAANLAGGVITLTGGELTINKGITIDASALAGGITINGNGASRVFNITNESYMSHINLIGLAIKGGSADKGGGIYNANTLTLTNCLIVKNSSNTSGGGIYNDGTLMLTNSTITGNLSIYYGGGIYNASTCNINNSIIAQNTQSWISDIYDTSNSVSGSYNLSSYTAWSATGSSNNLIYDSSKPLFMDAENGNWKLCADSQAIDVGCNDYVTTEKDLAGKTRIIGNVVDLGAYEYDYTPLTPLDTPQNVTLSVSEKTVTVAWDDVAGANKYVVTYADNEEFDGAKSIFVSTNSVELTLIWNTVYYFKVLSRDTTGNYADSEYSEIVSIKTDPDPTKLKAPTNIVLSVEGIKVTVTWDAVTGANKYIVTYADNIGFDNAKSIPVNTNSAEMSLAWDTTYYFKVMARDTNEIYTNSEYSETVSVKTEPDSTKLKTPANIVFSTDGKNLTVAWNAVENADRYLIFYSIDPTNMTDFIVSKTTSAVFSNLDIHQMYYVSIQARDSTKAHSNSDLSAPTLAFAVSLSNWEPTSGTLLATTVYPAKVKATYQWYRVDAQGVETRVPGKIGARYKVTEADKGFALKVVATVDDQTASASTSVVPLSTSAILLMKRKGTSLAITWRAVAGADTYKLTYSTDADFATYETVTTSANNTQIDDLTLGATYYAKVQAFDSTEKFLESAESAVKSVKLDKLGTPEITSVKTAGSTVTVDWTLVTGADRYVINYATNADFSGYKTKIINSAATNTYTLTGLTMGEIYYVRVQARNASNTYTSSEYSVRKIAVTKLATPEITTLTNSGTSVSIAWNAVENANRYVIMYSTDSEFQTTSKKIVGAVTEAAISGLTAGNTYYFKVQARDTAGKFITSNDSEVRSIALAASLPTDANLFDDEDEFDFLDDEILAAFGEKPEVLDVF